MKNKKTFLLTLGVVIFSGGLFFLLPSSAKANYPSILSDVSASGSTGSTHWQSVMLKGDDNKLCLYNVDPWGRQSINGCLSLNGFTMSGTTVFDYSPLTWAVQLRGDGDQLCLWIRHGFQERKNRGCLTLRDATVSGITDAAEPVIFQNTKLTAEGNQICLWGARSENPKQYNYGCVTITSNKQTCLPGTGILSADKTTCVIVMDDASFDSYVDLPVTITPGQTFTASIKMKNNGDTTWTTGASYRLGSQNLINNMDWGTSRLTLASDVAPGAIGTFTGAFTAPEALGVYNFQWKMVVPVAGVDKWFGAQTTNQLITVAVPACSSPKAPFVCSNPPEPVCAAGDTGIITGGAPSCVDSCNVVVNISNCPPSCTAKTTDCSTNSLKATGWREVAP